MGTTHTFRLWHLGDRGGGDMGAWGHGDMGTWGKGDIGAWGHAGLSTPTKTLGHRGMGTQGIFSTPLTPLGFNTNHTTQVPFSHIKYWRWIYLDCHVWNHGSPQMGPYTSILGSSLWPTFKRAKNPRTSEPNAHVQANPRPLTVPRKHIMNSNQQTVDVTYQSYIGHQSPSHQGSWG